MRTAESLDVLAQANSKRAATKQVFLDGAAFDNANLALVKDRRLHPVAQLRLEGERGSGAREKRAASPCDLNSTTRKPSFESQRTSALSTPFSRSRSSSMFSLCKQKKKANQ